jgi:hypothetical protein
MGNTRNGNDNRKRNESNTSKGSLAPILTEMRRQTCPADLPGRLARQTCPADLPGRLARQTCPADLPGRLARQMMYSDPLLKNPKSVSEFLDAIISKAVILN